MPALSAEQIRDLVTTTFGLAAGDVQEDTCLFSSGLLDSFHLVELITLLERRSGRKIRAGDVNLENLDTPRRIASFLVSEA
ncbi:MAG: acyl carrier protein [Planctomycetia bacterium]